MKKYYSTLNGNHADEIVENKISKSKKMDVLIENNRNSFHAIKQKFEKISSNMKSNFPFINKDYVDGMIKKIPDHLREDFNATMVTVQNDIDKLNPIGNRMIAKNLKTCKINENGKISRHLIN